MSRKFMASLAGVAAAVATFSVYASADEYLKLTPNVRPCLPPMEIFGGKCLNPCPPGLVRTAADSICVSPAILCPPLMVRINNKCVPNCGPGKVYSVPDGACVPAVVLCPPQTVMFNNKCVPQCPKGQVNKMPDGACGLKSSRR